MSGCAAEERMGTPLAERARAPGVNVGADAGAVAAAAESAVRAALAAADELERRRRAAERRARSAERRLRAFSTRMLEEEEIGVINGGGRGRARASSTSPSQTQTAQPRRPLDTSRRSRSFDERDLSSSQRSLTTTAGIQKRQGGSGIMGKGGNTGSLLRSARAPAPGSPVSTLVPVAPAEDDTRAAMAGTAYTDHIDTRSIDSDASSPDVPPSKGGTRRASSSHDTTNLADGRPCRAKRVWRAVALAEALGLAVLLALGPLGGPRESDKRSKQRTRPSVSSDERTNAQQTRESSARA